MSISKGNNISTYLSKPENPIQISKVPMLLHEMVPHLKKNRTLRRFRPSSRNRMAVGGMSLSLSCGQRLNKYEVSSASARLAEAVASEERIKRANWPRLLVKVARLYTYLL